MVLPFFSRIFQQTVIARHSQNTLFAVIALLYVLFFGFKHKRQHLDVSAIFALFFLSSYFNVYNYLSLVGLLKTFWLTIGLTFILGLLNTLKRESFDIILEYISIAALIQCAWVLLGLFNQNPYDWFTVGSKKMILNGHKYIPHNGFILTGSLNQPTVSGAWLSVAGCSFFRRKYYWAIPLCLVSLLLLDGSTSIASYFVCGALFLLFKKFIRNRSLVLLIPALLSLVAILGSTVGIPFLDDNGRFYVWTNGVKLNYGLEVLWGSGIDYFSDHFNRIYPHGFHVFRNAHNEFIECYVAFGAAGLLGFGYILVKYFKLTNDKVWTIIGVGVLINACTLHVFHIAPIALLGILALSNGLNRYKGV